MWSGSSAARVTHRDSHREDPIPAQAKKEVGPGSPGDAVAALASAIADLPHPAAGRGDPHVTAAFSLGWQMAELYRPHARRRYRGLEDDLPGLGSLDDAERTVILVDQIQAAVTVLSDLISGAGLAVVSLDALRGSLDGEDVRRRVLGLHRQLLATLTATDFRLGKAYGLGRALSDTCRKPTNRTTLQMELSAYRIAHLREWLDELSSALPPHAAHSVSQSLKRWTDWASTAPQEDGSDAVVALRRQGELWRALLSGEKAGSELLEIDNYVEAAGNAAGEMGRIARKALRRFPLLIIGALVLVVLGIGLLAWGGGSKDVAGATSILAAVGLTWKAIGSTLGQLAGKLEQPIWGAVLDQAIANAITLLPDSKHDHAGRREMAMEMAAGAPADVTAPH